MPDTFKQIGEGDPFNPRQNIDSGAKYLKQLLARYGGDVKLALGAYNAGPARVDASGDVPAKYEPAWTACRNETLKLSADDEMAGCETLIAAGNDVDNEIKAIAHANRGMLMAQFSYLATAKDELDAAIKLNPKLAPAYYNRAMIHAAEGEMDLAVTDYSSAVALNPKMVEAFVNRAIIYAESGKTDLAIADFTKVIELEPNVADGYANRGIALARSGQLEAALADFNKAIAVAPNDPEQYTNRANLYRKMGRETDAADDEAKAVALPGKR